MKYSKSLIYNKLFVFAALLAAALFAACSDDETTAPDDDNQPPEVAFTVAAVAVPTGNTKTLTVNCTDPDGDDVSVTWEVTRGTFTSPQGNPSINWRAPSTTGRDTITVTASDGKGGTTTIVETMQVGTVKASGISLSQTWHATNSPFIIQPVSSENKRFVIPMMVTLNIDAGCELLMDAEDLEIYVEGTMQSNGTETNPVVVRPNVRHPEFGHWQGITAVPDLEIPRIQLTCTDVLYAVEAVKSTTKGEVALDGCRIMFAAGAAVTHRSYQSLSVVNSIITNNLKSGIRVEPISDLSLPASIVVSNDSIAVNGDVSGSTPYVQDAGIYIAMADTFGTCDIQITNDEISRNAFPGIHLVNASRPIIQYNSIFANELGKTTQRYNIRLEDSFGGGVPRTIDARQNYWGAPYANLADSTEIRLMIRDHEDLGNITVRVAIDPWLNAKP
jgi:parallel beta-helix repeat protein